MLQKPREIAFHVLHQTAQSRERFDGILKKEWAKPHLSSRDRAMIQELIFGVIRHRRLLKYLICKFVKQPPRKALQIILELGSYQLLLLSRLPNYAVVNEMVNLAKSIGGTHASRFINGTLRNISEERKSLLKCINDLQKKQPQIAYSCPDWLFRRFRSRLSEKKLMQFLKWQTQPAKVFGRLNQLKYKPQSFFESCANEGLEIEPITLPWASHALMFQIRNPSALAQRKVFQSGGFYIQDPSTTLSVDMLSPLPGERVLDLCAAPGGKTAYAAERMQNQGLIVACDLVPSRLDRVRENCKRLGISNVRLDLFDGETASIPFDRVLVDVPCSNTGVLQRRVDLKWHLHPSQIRQLTITQSALISKAATHLKKGGVLVYSTCSLEPEENHAIVANFLHKHRNFALSSQRQLLPYEDGIDGAFVATLVKQ